MKLNDRFNKERVKYLSTKGYKDNDILEYCAKCNFQLYPGVHSLKFCPVCKSPLIAITVTPEMRALIAEK